MKSATATRALALALCLPAGCALPTVKLTTPEPVQVDINVRLDVYQHGAKDKPSPSPGASDDQAASNDSAAIEVRRRNRMGDIQLFKNSRIVGENRDGLLDVRTPPPGEYGEYVRDIVAAENADRMALMQLQAAEQGVPLAAVQSDRAKLWRNQAFNGEWIEEPAPGAAGHQWVQKGASL